jgi:hypothetical protein
MSKSIYHKHHIIPTHAGGTDTPDNLIRLTVEEHAEAHRLLYEEHGRWQDKFAWKCLAGHIGKEEIIRELQSRPPSALTRKRMSEAQKGKKHTEETRRKISEAQKYRSPESNKKIGDALRGRKLSGETCKRMSRGQTGRVHTEETRRKISEAQKGRPKKKGIPHTEEAKRNMRNAWVKRRIREADNAKLPGME